MSIKLNDLTATSSYEDDVLIHGSHTVTVRSANEWSPKGDSNKVQLLLNLNHSSGATMVAFCIAGYTAGALGNGHRLLKMVLKACGVVDTDDLQGCKFDADFTIRSSKGRQFQNLTNVRDVLEADEEGGDEGGGDEIPF
jgi:hypothetical protein